MAFNVHRFTLYNAGQTGAGLFAKYDGTGASPGGDALNTIKGDGYFSAEEVKDAIRLASDGRSTGAGLPMLMQANNGNDIDTIYLDGDTVKTRNAAFSLKV